MHTVIRLNPLLFHLAVPILAGVVCIQLSGDIAGVYRALALPVWAPAAGVVAAAWALLSPLTGFSAYLAYTDRKISHSDRNSAMTLYGLVLVMCFSWFLLFFRYRFFTFSALWSAVIFVVTGLCAALFYKIRRPAGLLLIPTLLCLGFISVLGFFIAALN